MKTKLNKSSILILLTFLSILLFITSCKKDTSESEMYSEAEETTLAETDKYQEKIKITLCLDSADNSITGKSLNEGMIRVKEELADYYEVTILEMGSDPLKWEEYLYQAADDYADIIIGIGSENKEYFETIPTEYPDTKFILIDQVIDYTEADLSNVLSVLFEEHYSGFLAGAAAALYTPLPDEEEAESNTAETTKPLNNIIGFIGEEKKDEYNNFLIGFIEGVKQIDPDIKILINFVETTKEDRTPEALANSQIEKGAQVIFTAAENSDSEVLEICSLAGVKAINCIYSRSGLETAQNEESVLLTSAMKLYDEGIFSMLKAYSQDEDSLSFGKTQYYSLDESVVGINLSNTLSLALENEKMEQLESLQNKIKEKQIFVPRASDMTEDELKEYILH